MSDRRKMLERTDRRHPGLVSCHLSSFERVDVRLWTPTAPPVVAPTPDGVSPTLSPSTGATMKIGDGGFVLWTQELTGGRTERSLIGGTGLDRLADLSGSARMETHQP